MTIKLSSVAEKEAQKAEELGAFGGLNLLHIKKQISQLLGQIGGQGIFDEYTKHDISHIDAMLELIDGWIIPRSTAKIMSTADWLMLVLAIYFHDMGMLVTKQEYRRRKKSDYLSFQGKFLFSANNEGQDYKAKVNSLPEEERERFIYQEFVRAHHAARIKAWITGNAAKYLGISTEVENLVEELLKPLGAAFRQDLGLVCESHHLDDLDNFEKYKVSQPYGNTPAETANLQFSAILLRTVDLLHITGDRTPPIVFRLINPSDPISQREWAKQMAVRAVRSQAARDSEGNVDPGLPRDTIEVHARFTEEDGFFGLTSYLNYAEKQLRRSYNWVTQAQKKQGVSYEFPWKFIDQSYIETQGFLKNQFEFTIDQVKILDLLTGHTLYNDSGVVLRELIQNSIDAVRLQFLKKGGSQSREKGRVRIHWDSKNRVLSVKDNGTGMSQEIIENNLLKVGASRYQEQRFQEENPDFTPISRFGIGVLSAFMLADDVDIVTCYPDDEMARRLLLRSVHGKYLIRLLDKRVDDEAKDLAPHGTKVSLRVRPSGDVGDVLETVRKWILIPECDVTVQIDGEKPEKIGFGSAKEAVEAVLFSLGYSGETISGDKEASSGEKGINPIRVHQIERNGVQLALALEWSEYFKEWSFVRSRQITRNREEISLDLGTCVEGIRVEFSTPGFDGQVIVAIANATGHMAPRTNVARSGIEDTEEKRHLLRTIYSGFASHIIDEITRLHEERSFSLTWAVGEGRYLIAPLTGDVGLGVMRRREQGQPSDRKALREALKDIPLLIVEHEGQRRASSQADLAKETFFWTVDCAFFRSMEFVLRDAPRDVSLKSLSEMFGEGYFELPDGPLLAIQSISSQERKTLFEKWEPDEIRVIKDQKRIDVKWTKVDQTSRWLDPTSLFANEIRSFFHRLDRRFSEFMVTSAMESDIIIPKSQIEFEGIDDEFAVEVFGQFLIVPGHPLQEFLLDSYDKSLETSMGEAIFVFGIISTALKRRMSDVKIVEMFEPHLTDAQREIPDFGKTIDMGRFRELLHSTNFRVFSPRFWERKEN